MELLGTQRGDVAALSASSVGDTAFAALSSDGTVSLWDVRLKQKSFVHISTARGRASLGHQDATEVLYVADRDLVVLLCGREVRFVDVRRQMDVLAVYTHTSEVVGFTAGKHPIARRTTLMVDEEGCVVPLDLTGLAPTAVVEEWVFGGADTEVVGGEGGVPGFGGLSNYCCGMGLVGLPGDAGGDEEEAPTRGPATGTGPRRALVTIGMDGKGELHHSPRQSFPVELSFDSLATDGSPQVVNPPLPACCGFCQERVAVGKADGMYEVLEVGNDGTTLEMVMAAPGHARNGLCVVHWTDAGRCLLSVSLCGQTTLWDTATFLAAGDDVDDGGDGDMPPVLVALDHRECVGSATAIVNAGTELCAGQFLLCDNEGNVTLSRLQ